MQAHLGPASDDRYLRPDCAGPAPGHSAKRRNRGRRKRRYTNERARQVQIGHIQVKKRGDIVPRWLLTEMTFLFLP